MSGADLQKLLDEQYGLITRAQALQVGISAKQLERLVHKGTWVRIHPSVFLKASAPREWPMPLMAAQLWSGTRALVSHQSAAALWGLDDFPKDRVELCGRRSLVPPPNVTFHHVRRLVKADIAKTRGLWLTTLERTLLDLASTVGEANSTERRLERAFDEALRWKRTTTEKLRWCLERNRHKGREGVALFEQLLTIREKYGVTRSPLESDFGHLLRTHELEEAFRSYEILEGARLLAEVDFAWPEKLLCVQVHGAEVHREEKTWHLDQRVENELQFAGWKVIKITHRMMRDDAPRLAAKLRNELALRATPPSAAAPARSR